MRVRRGVVLVLVLAIAVAVAYVVLRPHRSHPSSDGALTPAREQASSPQPRHRKGARPPLPTDVAVSRGRLGVLEQLCPGRHCHAALAWRAGGVDRAVRVHGRAFTLTAVPGGWLTHGLRLTTRLVSTQGDVTDVRPDRSRTSARPGDLAVTALDGDCWVWTPSTSSLHRVQALPGGRLTDRCWVAPDGTLVASTAPLNGQPHRPGLWSDAGGSWHGTRLPRGFNAPASLVGSGTHVAAAYLGDDVVIRRIEVSDDSGVTWRAVRSDLPYDTHAIAADGTALIAGADGRLARIVPAATTAAEVPGVGLQSVGADGSRFYAFTVGERPRLRTSTDGGRTWRAVRMPGLG